MESQTDKVNWKLRALHKEFHTCPFSENGVSEQSPRELRFTDEKEEMCQDSCFSSVKSVFTRTPEGEALVSYHLTQMPCLPLLPRLSRPNVFSSPLSRLPFPGPLILSRSLVISAGR